MNTESKFAETKSAGGLHVITRNPVGQTIEEAFPLADPNAIPLGNKVLVQLRTPKTKVGKIVLTKETQDQEAFATTIGKIISVGQIAYHRRDTGELWPEGVWVVVGDFVRVPKFGGDRWEIAVESDAEAPVFAKYAIYNDYEIFAKITGDPLKFRDYI